MWLSSTHARVRLLVSLLLAWSLRTASAFSWAMYFGKEPVTGEFLFVHPDKSLIEQSSSTPFLPGAEAGVTNEQVEQKFAQSAAASGWGVGWYASPGDQGLVGAGFKATNPQVKHSRNNPVFEVGGDRNDLIDPLLQKTTKSIQARVILGQVQSSFPVQESSLPFSWHGLLFLHDGGIHNFENSVKQRLLKMLRPEIRSLIKGTSDSEHAFALFTNFLRGVGTTRDVLSDPFTLVELQEAMELTIKELDGVDHEKERIELGESRFCLTGRVRPSPNLRSGGSSDYDGGYGSHSKSSSPAMSLNFVVTNGIHMIAARHRGCAEMPPTMYVSVGQKWDDAGSMTIGGSKDIHGIGAIVLAREPLSQHYANQWLLIDADEMVSATLVRKARHREDSESKGGNYHVTEQESRGVTIKDVLFMKKCMSTACHKRKALAFGRGHWGQSNIFWSARMTWYGTIVCAALAAYAIWRLNILKFCMVKCILWLRRKSRSYNDYHSR